MFVISGVCLKVMEETVAMATRFSFPNYKLYLLFLVSHATLYSPIFLKVHFSPFLFYSSSSFSAVNISLLMEKAIPFLFLFSLFYFVVTKFYPVIERRYIHKMTYNIPQSSILTNSDWNFEL